MMLSKTLKKIKSTQDLRAEKLRLRYEALRAEDAMNDSLAATEKLFTFFSAMRKAGSNVRYVMNAFSGISRIFGRLFGKKSHTEESPSETEYHDKV